MNSKSVKIKLSEGAKFCISALEARGFEAYVVGGCVRDAILGLHPADFDIATNALPTQTEDVFKSKGAETFDAGKKHGTISVMFKNGAETEVVEVTTYRSDGEYLDSRHPEKVEFLSSIEEDLARRDFTMNAIAYNPETGIVDPYAGISDIQSRLIRCVGDPKKRFSEDALRILRACRFRSQLGFSVEPKSWQSAVALKSGILSISDERITTEIDKMLAGENVCDALLECADVLEVAIPEITACRGFDQHTKYHAYDVWTHIAHVVQSVTNTQLLRWAALCHDLGKPSTFFMDEKGAGHFYGHELQGKRIATEMMKRFTLKNTMKEQLIKLVERHNDTLRPDARSIISTIRLLNGDVWLYRQLLELKRADSRGHASSYTKQVHDYDEIEKLLDEMLEKGIVFNVKDLAISGTDLLNLGLQEGPVLKEKLEIALQWVQTGLCPNTKDALISQMQKNLSR